jgi:hypothetical protein
VRSCEVEQLSDGFSDRPMVPAARQLAQNAQRLGKWLELRRDLPWHVERAEAVTERVPGEHVFFGNGKERPSQRREHRERVVGTFDGRECGSQRIDLLAFVESLAADEQVRDAA